MKDKKISKKKETKNQKRIKKLLITTKKLTKQKHGIRRKKNINGSFPYIFLITFINNNIFVNVNDLQGQTKIWTNAGRQGLQGKDKISHLGLIELFRAFLKTIYLIKIRKLIIKFNGFTKHKYIIKKEIRNALKKYKFQILAYEICLKIPFGGCRRKKKRRK